MAAKKFRFEGQLLITEKKLKDKLKNIKAIVFDWDGVFNDGGKTSSGGSRFSEVDSMGTNLLRYSFYLRSGKMPLTAIISGEKNETAFYFAGRECFNSSYFKVPNKTEALKHFCDNENVKASEIIYVFDDVLDLPIAEVCGLRMQVGQKANVNFLNYCIKNKMCDYVSSCKGGDHAVREICELLMGMNGNFDEVITTRKNYDKKYLEYIEKRRKILTRFYTLSEGQVNEVKI